MTQIPLAGRLPLLALALLALALLAGRAAPVAAQTTTETPAEVADPAHGAVDHADHTTPFDTDPTAPPTGATLTAAEQAVQATIARDGVHVVHFWAPWCENSTNEFRAGFYEVVEAHPDVSFTFVTIWNDGELSEAVLRRYGIPESVTLLAQPDDGPSADRSARRRTFLGLPLTWTPATWVFNRNGKLATAFNYGEVAPDQLTAAIENASASWADD